MGGSVAPCARASAVCMLMQLAQPFRIDERILTSSIRPFSRLFSAARLTAIHCFIRCGEAAKGSVMLVMSHLLCWGVPACRGRVGGCDMAHDKISGFGRNPIASPVSFAAWGGGS